MFEFLFQREAKTLESAAAGPASIWRLELFKPAQLSAFAELLPRLTHVRAIRIGWQQWAELPRELGQLPALCNLAVLNTPILEFPAFLQSCPRLERLVLRGTDIGRIPAEITAFRRLSYFDFSNNPLREIAPELGQLQSLRVLRLCDNRLQTLPDSLQHLKLTHLGLTGNCLNRAEAERILSWFPPETVTTNRL